MESIEQLINTIDFFRGDIEISEDNENGSDHEQSLQSGNTTDFLWYMRRVDW